MPPRITRSLTPPVSAWIAYQFALARRARICAGFIRQLKHLCRGDGQAQRDVIMQEFACSIMSQTVMQFPFGERLRLRVSVKLQAA